MHKKSTFCAAFAVKGGLSGDEDKKRWFHNFVFPKKPEETGQRMCRKREPPDKWYLTYSLCWICLMDPLAAGRNK